MSRRSLRLLTSGYYRDDGEMNESSSSHHLSYQESPVRVFKRRTGSRRQTLSCNGSQGTTPSLSHTVSQTAASCISFSSESLRGVASALKAAAQRQNQYVSPTSRSCSSGRSLLDQSCLTSGYSSSEECEAGLPPPWRKRSRLLSRTQRTMLFASLTLLCCNLFGLLRDVLLLCRYSPLHTPTAAHSELPDPKIVTDFNVFRKEVLDRINQGDARWKDSWTRELDDVKREISLLQKDGERHRHMSEILNAEITYFKDVAKTNDLDQQAWMTKKVTELKDSVSYLRTVQHNLEQRMDAQEYTNAQLKEELTDWLKRELRAGLGQDTGSVVLHPELQGELEALEKRLLHHLAEVAHKERSDMWRTVGESLQKEGLGAITVKDVHEIVQRALSLYKSDGTGMADYALESLGATVIESRCTETYRTRSRCYSLFGVPLWYASESPRTVIQPEVYPGKCWAFKGSEGFLTIALSLPVRVTHVTLEHIPKSLSPTGRIDSAPREFAVYGLSGFDEQEEGKFLGRFTYDSDGEPIQTFELPDSVKDVYRALQLRVLSNWGNPEYSCIYRFRVHGQPLSH
ncbi:SUN domain-containing protein 1-like [Alosa pseudoharengus]|uniref:SUN domain-containing protein 1-like n=1 Tax=Alosa pseudoharengus TaxID=34774 RepID=UPI003F8CB30F